MEQNVVLFVLPEAGNNSRQHGAKIAMESVIMHVERRVVAHRDRIKWRIVDPSRASKATNPTSPDRDLLFHISFCFP